MSYKSLIESSRENGYRRQTATKILDMMKKLRLELNQNSSRRWIWELIQNAKDVSYRDIGVNIEIETITDGEDSFLKFSHNGKTFSSDNITFLIEQVSTKDRSNDLKKAERTTGRFGTGFLTTHLLSEKVTVTGVLKEEEEAYKKFEILIDRSGRDIPTILNSIDMSLSFLDSIDKIEDFLEYKKDDCNTSFSYHLTDSGIANAQLGIQDLDNSLAFSLVLLPEINSIKLVDSGTIFKLLSSKQYNGNIFLNHISKVTENSEEIMKIISLSKNDTTIFIPIEIFGDKVSIKAIDSKIPKLFCDFPLLGAEDFPFPVIINNPSFNINEPRDGIFLTNAEDEEVRQNEKFLFEALELYNDLLNFASKNSWQNIHLLATIPSVPKKDWLKDEWFKEEITNPIVDKLLKTPIIDTENGDRVALLTEDNKINVIFPYGKSQELRKEIWDLLSQFKALKYMPKKDHLEIWNNINLYEKSRLKLESLCTKLNEIGDVENLQSYLVEGISKIEWLNEFFRSIKKDEKPYNSVNNDEYSIIPNQNGFFVKKSDIYVDESIEEPLKDVLKVLGSDIRNKLIHKEVNMEGFKFQSYVQEEIITEINSFIKHKSPYDIKDALLLMSSLFSNDNNFPKFRNCLYEYLGDIFGKDSLEKKYILNWNNEIWEESDKNTIKLLIMEISECKDLYTLSEKLCHNSLELTVEWLCSFISFLNENGYNSQLELKTYPILPNQNNVFIPKEDLYFEDDIIDEEIKDIAFELQCDIREELIHKDIELDFSNSRGKTLENLANDITKEVKTLLTNPDRSDKVNRIFKNLLLWFDSNKELASNYFEWLYQNKHKLYNDEEIVNSIKKSAEVEDLLKQFELEDINALRTKLKLIKEKELKMIDKEDLLSLGISSLEEFEEAMGNNIISSEFFHTSTPTVEMFNYGHNKRMRAKRNVISHLKSLSDYNCDYLEELSPTVLGGIMKNGEYIKVVVRPSDNGQVLIYYGAEKDVFDYDKFEFWIDNGIKIPEILTLGRILKNTGITRIPV